MTTSATTSGLVSKLTASRSRCLLAEILRKVGNIKWRRKPFAGCRPPSRSIKVMSACTNQMVIDHIASHRVTYLTPRNGTLNRLEVELKMILSKDHDSENKRVLISHPSLFFFNTSLFTFCFKRVISH